MGGEVAVDRNEMHLKISQMIAPYLGEKPEDIESAEFEWQFNRGFRIQAKLRDGRTKGFVDRRYEWR